MTHSIIPGNIGSVSIPPRKQICILHLITAYNFILHGLTEFGAGFPDHQWGHRIGDEIAGIYGRLALCLLTFIDFAGSHHPEMGRVFVGPAPPQKKNLPRRHWPVGRFLRNQDLEGSSWCTWYAWLTCSNLVTLSDFCLPIVENRRHQGLG